MNVILGPVVPDTEESLAILRSPRIILRDSSIYSPKIVGLLKSLSQDVGADCDISFR